MSAILRAAHTVTDFGRGRCMNTMAIAGRCSSVEQPKPEASCHVGLVAGANRLDGSRAHDHPPCLEPRDTRELIDAFLDDLAEPIEEAKADMLVQSDSPPKAKAKDDDETTHSDC